MRDDAADLLAAQLTRRGLAAPARLLLDAHRPLAPVLSDLAVALGPLAGLLGGRVGREVDELFGEEDGIERTIAALDR